MCLPRGTWQLAAPSDAKSAELRVTFALPLPARADGPLSLPVGLLWPVEAARAEANVRVWVNSVAGRTVSASTASHPAPSGRRAATWTGRPGRSRTRSMPEGCPWSCAHASREIVYDMYDYPQTLDVIRGTLLVGHRLCMASFLERENLELYLAAFHKVFSHRDELVEYARGLDYREPWEQAVRLW